MLSLVTSVMSPIKFWIACSYCSFTRRSNRIHGSPAFVVGRWYYQRPKVQRRNHYVATTFVDATNVQRPQCRWSSDIKFLQDFICPLGALLSVEAMVIFSTPEIGVSSTISSPEKQDPFIKCDTLEYWSVQGVNPFQKFEATSYKRQIIQRQITNVQRQDMISA